MTAMVMSIAGGRSSTTLAIGAGLVVGVAYTLSPLTVLSLAVLVWASRAASRGLPDGERRWFWCLLSTAVVIRLAAIAWLFLTNDPSRPFASFFGDEELYKFRTVWIRNLGQGIPMSPADVIYSVDDVGRTSYMYFLALVQALVGDAPYGLHVMNMTFYLCAVVALYRLARASFGSAVSLAGLTALLFLPSLASWSISVLKEPINVFMLAGELICAVAIVRAPRYWQRAMAVAGVVLFALAMESLRTGGLLTAALGTVGGLSLAFVLGRGRRLVVALVAVPIAVAIVASSSAVHDRVLANLRYGAFYHAGHVLTPGHTYLMLEPPYYRDRERILNRMPPSDAARYAVMAAWSYFAQPLPWQAESRALRAYLPEQLLWYAMALLLPLGIVAGMRRDGILTSMLVMHAAGAIVLVALTSGNIGTLIRHRSLALPYLVWLSALGGHELIRLVVDRSGREEGSGLDGDR